MNIGIIYSTNNSSTEKSCRILSEKIKAEVKLIPIEKARNDCLLKYNFIILAASAINGRVQGSFKIYISKNMKTLRERPVGLIINCEDDADRFDKTFTEELMASSYAHANFGYELNPSEGNIIEKRLTNKIINKFKKNDENLPALKTNEINDFANIINEMIEKRVD